MQITVIPTGYSRNSNKYTETLRITHISRVYRVLRFYEINV